jgi:hypothetical protein
MDAHLIPSDFAEDGSLYLLNFASDEAWVNACHNLSIDRAMVSAQVTEYSHGGLIPSVEKLRCIWKGIPYSENGSI